MLSQSRFEFENVFYHAMNSGRGGHRIFEDDRYYWSFLETLQESQQRLDLLIEPVEETYVASTQHYNRLKQADGILYVAFQIHVVELFDGLQATPGWH